MYWIMKKKENLWQLLERLDKQAGELNIQSAYANHYFDTASEATKKLLKQHEKDLQKTVAKLRKTLKAVLKKDKDKKG